MHHIPVPNLNVAAGRFIAGALNLSIDHPIVTCFLLTTGATLSLLAGAAALSWPSGRIENRRTLSGGERPIRLWRR